MPNKAVTLLISTISNGGAESVCVNIANGLAERGWKVDLLVLHTKNSSYLNRLSPKVNLVDLKAQRARYAGPALLWYLMKYKPRQLIVFKYELIDLVVLIKKIFRLKVRVIGRNISILSEKQTTTPSLRKRLVQKFFGTPLEQVDSIINQSYAMEEDLVKVIPSLRSKSIVIHNPVSAHIEDHAQAEGVKRMRSSYILCVGRLEKVKAFDQAIKAFALIAEKFPDLRLKFLGQGSLEIQLKQLAENLKVDDRVDFEGFQSDVISFYEHAQLTLLTSNYEGFPNVLIESIVMGTPVVSFDCPSGPREILDYGRYGKLVAPGDTVALADAIEETLTKPNQFPLAERAKFFSVEKAINKYIHLLEQQ